MPIEMEKMDQIAAKADSLAKRFDAFKVKRQIRRDAQRKNMADARMAKAKKRLDAFEEAKHPRNANGVFAVGEGEEASEDTQSDPGSLSKRNIDCT